MVKKAYIILAHKNAPQVNRLVERLDDKLSHFFIHVDLNTSIEEFKILMESKRNLYFVDRVATPWGGFGLVQATLNGMMAVKKTRNEFDIISLLSGQDYPIKSNEEINSYFESSAHSVFIDYFSLPNYGKWRSGGGMYRVDKYFLGLSKSDKYTAKALNFLGRFIPSVRRNPPEKLNYFAGSQWWSIDMYALNYILNYVRNNPQYKNFHKHTFASDELFFHTILLNSKDNRLLASISNDNMRFMKWTSSLNAHPEMLLQQDLESISESSALFARKFDTTKDAKILDMIDELCFEV